MKKSLSILSLGAGMMVAFTACQQSQNDYPGGVEEAMPMSEMAVADGELPPWLLEDNEDSDQVPAGSHTDHSFPDDEIVVADEPESGAASQNQPELAADDTIVDAGSSGSESASGATVIPAPVAANTPTAPKPAKPVAVATPKPVKKPIKRTTGPSTADIKKLTAKERKRIKKPVKPTVVTYKVRPGDNLTLIAKRSNTTVAQIRKDSNIVGDKIYPGQIIKVKYYPKGSKAAARAAAEARKAGTSHTVKRGESISSIAAKHGVTTAAILKANNMSMKDAARVQSGRKLIIPGKSNASSSSGTSTSGHTVKRGESISTIAAKHGITTAALLKANNMTRKDAARIRPGRELVIPTKGKANSGRSTGRTAASSYTVKNGESISGIAAKHGVSTSALLKANNMTMSDAARIRPGRKLTIPAKANAKNSRKRR